MSVGEKVMSQGGAAQQKVMEGSSQEVRGYCILLPPWSMSE